MQAASPGINPRTKLIAFIKVIEARRLCDLQVVSIVRAVQREVWIQRDDERSDGEIRCVQRASPAAEEEKSERHSDRHVVAVREVVVGGPQPK